MSETLEEIAERIARAHIGTASYHDAARQLLKEDVLSALRNERERAAKVGFDTVKALGDSVYEYSVTQKAAMVAAAIREGR